MATTIGDGLDLHMNSAHPIYITAVVFTVVAVGILGGILFKFAERSLRGWLALVATIELPLCALAFYGVRMPVDALIKSALMDHAGLYGFVQVLYAPLTEEPAKLIVFLIPAIARRVDRRNLSAFALAIGLGFGVGEGWLVAYWIAASGQFADLPWYQFSGYLNERFMVCVCHAGFTGVCLFLALEKGRKVAGFLASVGLHYLANLPIYLCGPAVLNLPPAVGQIVLGLWIVGCFVAAAVFLIWASGNREPLSEKLLGSAKCPNCGEFFKRSLWGLNAGFKRLEKCPHCTKWVLTTKWNEGRGSGDGGA